MKYIVKRRTVLLSLLWLISPLLAQNDRFSGRWVLNCEKTQMMQMPDISIEISQAGGVVHYRKTVKNPPNEWVTQMELTADGKEGSYADLHGNRLKCSCVFQNGIFTLTYQSKQMRSGKWVILDMKDELSVSADGNTLSIVHTERWEGKVGKWPRPMVFDRQAENAGKVQETKKGDKKVIVATSHDTYSSGFTMLRYLYKSGATVAGSTSAQSGNRPLRPGPMHFKD